MINKNILQTISKLTEVSERDLNRNGMKRALTLSSRLGSQSVLICEPSYLKNDKTDDTSTHIDTHLLSGTDAYTGGTGGSPNGTLMMNVMLVMIQRNFVLSLIC